MSAPERMVAGLTGDSGLVASGSVELEQGARGVLLLVDDLFRLDVCSRGDTLRVIVRPLAGAESALGGSGYSGAVVSCSERLDRLVELSPARFDLTLDLRRDGLTASAPVLIGALGIPESGATRFTGQAILTGALAGS